MSHLLDSEKDLSHTRCFYIGLFQSHDTVHQAMHRMNESCDMYNVVTLSNDKSANKAKPMAVVLRCFFYKKHALCSCCIL